MEKEIWKSIKGYDGLYEISSNGRVKRLARTVVDSLGRRIPYKEMILAVSTSKRTGYPCVSLTKDGNSKKYNIHTLIADAFIPNPENLPCVNHIDENRSNSVLSNLERCTYSYNNSYGQANKKRKKSLRKYLEGRHRRIYQFTKDGELIATYDCGVSQLEERLGFLISDCLSGRSKTANGYCFSYEKQYKYVEDHPASHQKYVLLLNENGEELERYKSVSEAARRNGFDRHNFSRKTPVGGIITIDGKRFVVEKKENEYIPKGHKGPRPDLSGKGVKAVCQYTKDGRFIQKFASLKEAAESIGVPKSAPEISNCCNGKLKTARGYIWAFEGKEPHTFKNESIRPVAQYAIDGEYIATYDSIIQAAKAVNGRPGSIQNNVSGRSHSAYGYIWKYAKQ